ncbi:tyrosine-type recombinase/integrase [Streptomyces sp. ME02-8801-2C]|nr:tyrosine-type recombinase/integrase [Streptomyces sp. ME02-8801-2C]
MFRRACGPVRSGLGPFAFPPGRAARVQAPSDDPGAGQEHGAGPDCGQDPGQAGRGFHLGRAERSVAEGSRVIGPGGGTVTGLEARLHLRVAGTGGSVGRGPPRRRTDCCPADGRSRRIPATPKARPACGRRPTTLRVTTTTDRILSAGPAPDARLFTGPRGGRVSTAVLRDATHWEEVVTRLGYEHLRRHCLRHTGPTWFADAGVPLHVLRRIAGHGSLTTTQRYLHPDVHKITAAGAALSAHLSVLRAPRTLPVTTVLTR